MAIVKLIEYSGYEIAFYGLIAFLLYRVGLIAYRLCLHPLAKFPGPPSFAATYLTYNYHSNLKGTLFRDMIELHEKYGDVVRIGPDHIAVDGSVGWPQVCGYRSKGEEFGKMPGTHPGDMESILVAPRESHRRQRRQLSHAFSDASLTEKEPTINKYIGMLLDNLGSRADKGEAVNVVDWFNFALFDIVGELTFSESFHSLENNGYHPWVGAIFEGIRGLALLQLFKDYWVLGYIIDALNLGMTSKKAIEVRGYTEEKTKTRLDYETATDKPESMSRDFISYMLRSPTDGSPGMKTSEIYASCPTLVVAGSETTATALSGMCFYVSQNKPVYDALAEEVRSAFSSESEITLRSAAALEYLQAVVSETFRIFPPAAENPVRVSPGAVINDIYVPKGTRVSIYQWATFRSPRHFVDPDSFIPERWLNKNHPRCDERFSNDHRDLVKPFSFGSRDCIGKNLAQSEMRYIVARLIYRFDFSLPFAQDKWHDSMRSFLLWEKAPLQVQFKRRVET